MSSRFFSLCSLYLAIHIFIFKYVFTIQQTSSIVSVSLSGDPLGEKGDYRTWAYFWVLVGARGRKSESKRRPRVDVRRDAGALVTYAHVL